jgi:hypothetical protein
MICGAGRQVTGMSLMISELPLLQMTVWLKPNVPRPGNEGARRTAADRPWDRLLVPLRSRDHRDMPWLRS